MTDMRLPERLLMDRKMARLNDAEFRGLVMATLWCVSNRTDGIVLTADLPMIHWIRDGMPDRFVELELWEAFDDGWTVVDFEKTQTTRDELDVLENARRRDREKKRRQRARPRDESGPVFTDPGDFPGDVSPRTSQEGQAGMTEWETARIPDAKECVVCGRSMPSVSPWDICGMQDEQHNRARASRAA